MPACEKCWGEATRRAMFSSEAVSDHYYRVMREAEESGTICTPREKAGQFWDEERQRDSREED